MPSTGIQIQLTDEQYHRIEELRARDGRTVAAVVSAALSEYLAIHVGQATSIEPTERWRVLDETFGSMPDLSYPDRDDWVRGYG